MPQSSPFVEVAVPLPIFQTFHYKYDASQRPHQGSCVLVRFKNRALRGYVVGFPKEGFSEAKSIIGVADAGPLFSEKMLVFFRWIANHYAAPLGEVIKGALPAYSAKKPRPPTAYAFQRLPVNRPARLTDAQKTVLASLKAAVALKTFSPFLLHGVTGSGKTEIYLTLIEEALRLKKEALVLVPEISLTPQLLSRFEDRFPGKIAVLHSRLTANQRYHEWLNIKHGKSVIAIGARSAIFAPFENLGVIIVDEEHDTSFKQEERFRYHARDLALVRGRLESALVLLGSATPSLESFYNTRVGKIKYLSLPERIDRKPLPTVEIIDLKEMKQDFGQNTLFSDRLLQCLTACLDQRQQAMLLLNRRGYSPFLLCQTCGLVPHCPYCSVTLTVYSHLQKLMCHHCAHARKIPAACADCGGSRLIPIGMGTEKVETFLKNIFPSAKIARMDRTTTQKHLAMENIFYDFSKQKIDILIGTQMIAKGHDFPNVTVVGVILADVSLNIPDFRSPERTFQLMTQVAGRAGRGNSKGHVIIQTFNPQHYSIQHAQTHDTRAFYQTELSHRRELGYPPFSKMVHFKVGDPDEASALAKMRWLFRMCHQIKQQHAAYAGIALLGPSPSPLSKIKNKFRFHMLLKAPAYKEMRGFLNHLFANEKELHKPPRIHIDVDPLNLL